MTSEYKNFLSSTPKKISQRSRIPQNQERTKESWSEWFLKIFKFYQEESFQDRESMDTEITSRVNLVSMNREKDFWALFPGFKDFKEFFKKHFSPEMIQESFKNLAQEFKDSPIRAYKTAEETWTKKNFYAWISSIDRKYVKQINWKFFAIKALALISYRQNSIKSTQPKSDSEEGFNQKEIEDYISNFDEYFENKSFVFDQKGYSQSKSYTLKQLDLAVLAAFSASIAKSGANELALLVPLLSSLSTSNAIHANPYSTPLQSRKAPTDPSGTYYTTKYNPNSFFTGHPDLTPNPLLEAPPYGGKGKIAKHTDCQGYALNIYEDLYIEGNTKEEIRENFESFLEDSVDDGLLSWRGIELDEYNTIKNENFKSFINAMKTNGGHKDLIALYADIKEQKSMEERREIFGADCVPAKDYHFYRLLEDGSWAHKLTGLPPINTDYQGKKIFDPQTADRTHSQAGIPVNGTSAKSCVVYSELLGFFEIERNSKQLKKLAKKNGHLKKKKKKIRNKRSRVKDGL